MTRRQRRFLSQPFSDFSLLLLLLLSLLLFLSLSLSLLLSFLKTRLMWHLGGACPHPQPLSRTGRGEKTSGVRFANRACFDSDDDVISIA